jgi:hypothetical protein
MAMLAWAHLFATYLAFCISQQCANSGMSPASPCRLRRTGWQYYCMMPKAYVGCSCDLLASCDWSYMEHYSCVGVCGLLNRISISV